MTMFRYRKMWRIGIVASFLLGTAIAGAQEMMSPGSYKAPLRLAVQLPPYCWGQYFGRTEPQYQLPRNCGPRINHFCGAFIKLFKAREEKEVRRKRKLLRRAERGILYTKNVIANIPNCPLHTVVDEALFLVRMEIQRHQ